jgi:hypothetical protein
MSAAFAALLCIGCSFQLSFPPIEPQQRTARAAARCGGVEQEPVLYPLVDTLSVVAGVTWVVHADREGRVPDSQRNAERIAGYGIVGLFGAGAVYGYAVAVTCASLRREVAEGRGAGRRVAEGRPGASKAAPPGSFPRRVFAFEFGMDRSQAESACRAMGRSWELEGPTAVCRAPRQSLADPEIRLEFELGALTRLRALYTIPRQDLRGPRKFLDRSGRMGSGPRSRGVGAKP